MGGERRRTDAPGLGSCDLARRSSSWRKLCAHTQSSTVVSTLFHVVPCVCIFNMLSSISLAWPLVPGATVVVMRWAECDLCSRRLSITCGSCQVPSGRRAYHYRGL